jgi:hypothetical protein
MLSSLSPEQARWAADTLLVVHGLFIVWVVVGGVVVLRWPRAMGLHLPTVAWAVWISVSGGICPLTPWEWQLRERAGQGGFEGGFIEHYLVASIYPEGLTRAMQFGLAAFVLAVNALAYGLGWRRWRRRGSTPRSRR